MTVFGYHASHEQFTPSQLLAWATAAERAGFQAGMCSDHYAPWTNRQGESGFAWSWLGAALQATTLSFGTVTAPIDRYHPVIIAQACATLAEMYPGRSWVALGSGLAVNERFLDDRWPPKWERQLRIEEAADAMRRLWAGETVTHRGTFTAEEAVLYTTPAEPPLLVGAAVSPASGQWVGRWADALITILQPGDAMMETVAAFREGGGEGKPIFLQAQHSYAAQDEEALAAAHDQWSANILDSAALAEIPTPSGFEAGAAYISRQDVAGHIRASSRPEEHAAWLRSYTELGFDRVYIHNVGRNQAEFIDVYGREVLPALIPTPAKRAGSG